jgi:hypothetical protein
MMGKGGQDPLEVVDGIVIKLVAISMIQRRGVDWTTPCMRSGLRGWIFSLPETCDGGCCC